MTRDETLAELRSQLDGVEAVVRRASDEQWRRVCEPEG
jgi:hypothetical protein